MRRHSHLVRAFAALAVFVVALGCQSGNAATDGAQKSEALSHPAVQKMEKPEDPKVIGQGAEVDLAAQRDPERITVFDFTSEYCPPCRQIAPFLDRLHDARADLAVVKVDINRPSTRGIDWASPTARQFGLQQIPHFKVMDKEGTMIAEGSGAWDLIVKWITAIEQPGGR